MRIQIRERDNMMTPKLHAHALRRVGFALSRFGRKVVSVIVRVSKTNGSPGSGGIDTRCQIDVGLERSVKATATDGDPLVSVERAVASVERSVVRALARERETEQRPEPPPTRRK